MATQNNSKKCYNLFISLTCKKKKIFHLTEELICLFVFLCNVFEGS